MDIPPGGFFTPKRPSFRVMPAPPQGRSGNGRRPLYNSSGIHPRRSYGYQTNFSPGFVNDHRRSMYHQQDPYCYIDRFGRIHDYGPPMYPMCYNRVYQVPVNPAALSTVTASSSNSSVGGNDDTTKNLEGSGLAEKAQNENTQTTNEGTFSPPSSRTSGDSGNPVSPEPSTLNANGRVEGTPNDANLKTADVNQGSSQDQIAQQPQFIPQQQKPPDSQLYNYNTPAEEINRRRRFPTQIPIQAIHYNDEINQGWNMNQKLEQEVSRALPLPMSHQAYSKGFDVGFQQQQPPMFMEQQHGLGTGTQHNNHFPQMPHGTPYPSYRCPQAPMEHLPCNPNPNMHPAMMPCVSNRAPIYADGGEHPYKLIDVARAGYQSFQNDFKENETQGKIANHLKEEPGANPKHQGGDGNNESTKATSPEAQVQSIEFADIRFDVDDRDFIDKRPIINLVEEGGKEYKLFEDQMNPVRDIIREIYNVNEMDPLNVTEMCGMKVLPQNLLQWPLHIIGANWGNLRKRIVNFNGEIGRNGVCPKESQQIVGAEGGFEERKENDEISDCCGSYGVSALAKLFFQGGGAFPPGYSTFIGMNLEKLMKDLDSKKPITPGFPGPHADRNHSYDSGWAEVVSGGVKEYDLPFEADADSPFRRKHEAYEWIMKHRIKRSMFTSFSFEILLFIFYTFTGDALQLLAAKEIYLRGWRFHKIFQVWITPWISGRPGDESGISENGEWLTGIYKYFHYGKWAFFKGEFKVNEYLLEGTPLEVEDALWD